KPEYGWKKEVVGNLNFTQNKFDNWAQGGEDSWSWQLDLNAKFENDQELYNWANTGKFSFGQAKIGDADSRKAADELKLESVYTYKFNNIINPYVALTAKTQIAKGYQYTDTGKFAISDLLDPGYFTQSIGIGYKPNETIKTRFGAAIKETVADKYGYADDPETTKLEKTRTEYGAESVTDLDLKLSENILFKSKLEMFSTLDAINEVDVNWDNMFTAKVSEYINVSFNLNLFYDRDISNSRQLKQTLAVGLSYNLL
ncbi:DUF3078 domain-containing protein, partial [Calditrichota bacterium]